MERNFTYAIVKIEYPRTKIEGIDLKELPQKIGSNNVRIPIQINGLYTFENLVDKISDLITDFSVAKFGQFKDITEAIYAYSYVLNEMGECPHDKMAIVSYS